jgi:hypothetical protein
VLTQCHTQGIILSKFNINSHYNRMAVVIIKGAVTISPPGIATVCSGDQLELNFSVTDSGSFALLVWNVTLIPKNAATPVNYNRAISSSSPSDQTFRTVINSTYLTFSQLISRLLFSPVSSWSPKWHSSELFELLDLRNIICCSCQHLKWKSNPG